MPKCHVCRTVYTRQRLTQKVCGDIECAIEFGRRESKRKLEKAGRQALREGRERIKSRRDWMKEAQAEFNKYIRAKDAGKPCISCGRTEDQVEMTTGGKWDCGHYLSVGSHPELRFDEDNAAKQCKRCNGGAGRFAKQCRTVTERYRLELIKRIGIDGVEWLEGPHEAKNYTIDDLKIIKNEYKAKLKELGQ